MRPITIILQGGEKEGEVGEKGRGEGGKYFGYRSHGR